MRECYGASCVRSYFAGMVLALNLLILSPPVDKRVGESNVQEAQQIIEMGTETFKEGSLFQMTAALCATGSQPLLPDV